MTTFHHLYPFPPWNWHGGTMRLRSAIEGSDAVGSSDLRWWDAVNDSWRSEPTSSVGLPSGDVASSAGGSGLKRRLFPSTLWESGRRPNAAADQVGLLSPGVVVLHTSYLSPLARRMRADGHRVVVDVHDVVFRAHRDDAIRAREPLRSIRRAYAGTVRHRELRALAGADALILAGWDDAELLRRERLSRVFWAPTGIETSTSTSVASETLRIGLIGNFAHNATLQAAHELLTSPAGTDPRAHIVFAGLGSERMSGPRVLSLGRVGSVGEFYDQVDATVVPVTNGSGMKCKLAEGALAGKAVVTTPPGAAGYPPELRALLTVVESPSQITYELVERAGADVSGTARDAFLGRTGRRAAADAYKTAFASVAKP